MKLANIHRATRKRLAAIVMIAAAVVGFVSQSESKDEYLVTKERLTRSTLIPLVVTVSPLAQHTIDLWGVDEEMGYQWANLEVRYTIRDDSGKLLGEDGFSASESNAKGGFKRAANGDTVHLSPSPSSLHIEVELIRGDYVDIEVYRDLPTWTELAPGIYVLLGFTGVVLYMKSNQPRQV